ncbi:hypothetical protein CY34DRAFT_569890 [Suillus luteus UH-Slu-Lm8-n1]|uniref:Uncharacterized protein n=1 Tax=Suillus luteus UH-Slu-Lm8-n1 TaxID=930992 RepID=A0A0D0AUH5_9AGAM|nr:hypothetical protein CY34DRAFT_569890 [Suillus luteus UH-Slu-Lm8-n1]
MPRSLACVQVVPVLVWPINHDWFNDRFHPSYGMRVLHADVTGQNDAWSSQSVALDSVQTRNRRFRVLSV